MLWCPVRPRVIKAIRHVLTEPPCNGRLGKDRHELRDGPDSMLAAPTKQAAA
jgi:hypothetical protein